MKMKSKPLIVFDMDGVIIDVSRSYRDTVRQTARLFFKGAQSWKDLPNPLFPLSDLARIKQGGGLNNDWDLTCLIIDLLFSVTLPSHSDSTEPPGLELVAGKGEGFKGGGDTDNWPRYKKVIRNFDVTELARFLKSTKKPLTTLLKKNRTPNA